MFNRKYLEFKVYVTDLAAYNNGFLIGEWIDLTLTTWEEVKERVNKILLKGHNAVKNDGFNSNEDYDHIHEEYFITDYENNINVSLDEYENLKSIYDKIESLEDLNIDIELLEKVFESGEKSFEDIDENFDISDCYFIEALTPRELGEVDFIESFGEPYDFVNEIELRNERDRNGLKLLADHFNFENYGNDLLISGGYHRVTGGYLRCPL